MLCKSLAVFWLFTCLLQEGSGLSCFKCVSSADGDCGDGFKEFLVTQFTCHGAIQCYKLDASGLVSRGCNDAGMGPGRGLSLCDSENCNSGLALKMSVVLLAATSAAALLRI